MIFSLISPRLSITFLPIESYRAATRGFQVHFADLMAIILCFAMLIRREEYTIRWLPPMIIPMLLFFTVGWISWALVERNTFPIYDIEYQAGQDDPIPYFEIGLYPLFELFKIWRGIFIFWVSFNFLQDKQAHKYFVAGFCALVLYITGAEFDGRYVYGDYRPSFDAFHFNDVNTFVGLTSLAIFPLAFVVRSFFSCLWFWFIMGCGFISIILTVSRSSLVGFFIGAFIIIVMMVLRNPTARNWGMTLLAAFVVFLCVLKAAGTLLERFNVEEYDVDIEERTLLNDAAYLMGKEHLFGVGLGNFSAWNINLYADRVGANSYNLAHNTWFLTFAEVGYPGIIFFALIWIRLYQMLFVSLRIYKRFSNVIYGYPLLIGILSSSIVMQFQNRYHFTYRQMSIYYTMHILMAIVARAYADRRVVVRNFARKHQEEVDYQLQISNV
jgi:hypothetical protein